MEVREAIQEQRRAIWLRYRQGLAGWAQAAGVRLPVVPEHCDQAYHMFFLLLPSLEDRQRLIAHLRERGILAVFHYLPLHLSPMGTQWAGPPGDCPATESVSDQLIRLPFYNSMTESEQSRVVDEIIAFNDWAASR